MFKISSVSLVVALASISALAAPQMSAHERALQKASKWSDLTAQLKGRLPSNVVKEFADFAKDEEFPSARRIRNKLVITESDGTKVVIEYKKNGTIALNGKEWKLRPLATVEEEVSRLALFINGETKASSGFFGLVPAAQAGGAAVGGSAVAAFAGANAWKAESCGEEALSGDLVNDCPLMGVGMQPILASAKIDDTEKLMPVQLKCPAENSGIFELISKNKIGQVERIRVQYTSDKPRKISVEAAEKAATFEEYFSVDLTSSKEADQIDFGNSVIQRISPVAKEVCNGSKKQKSRYLAALKANREDLNQSAKSDDASEEKGAIEAL